MRLRSLSLAVVLLLGVGTGCMTVVRGDKQKVRVDTDPTDATVVVNDKTYTTPFEATLFRKEKYEVLITKAGYTPVSFEYIARGDGMSETSLVLPGGSAIYATDQVSGASREFGKLAVIKLTPLGATTRPMTEPARFYEFEGTLHATDAERQTAMNKKAEDFQRHLKDVKHGK